MGASHASDFDEMSVSERILLVQDLWDRIAQEGASVPVPEWQRRELQRRIDLLDSGKSTTRPWADVLDDARQRLKR